MSDNQPNYIEDANRTKSTSYYPGKVELSRFLQTLNGAIGHLNELDRIKKALFYGKPIFPGHTPIGDTCDLLPIYVLGENPSVAVDILHGIIGKATEGCELLEALEDAIQSGKMIDYVNLGEEIGDGQWYDAILAKAIGVSFESVQRVNIAKLRKRYPEKFTDDDAINRDVAAERVILAGAEPVHVAPVKSSHSDTFVEPVLYEETERAGHLEVRGRIYQHSSVEEAKAAAEQPSLRPGYDESSGVHCTGHVDYDRCDGVED